MNKVVGSADEAIQDVFDSANIMVGGFGLCGIPENLIRALVRKGVKDLTTISNNVGVDGFGMGLLLAAGQIRKHIGTYVGENKLLEQMVLQGKVELDLVPQGTFSERIRAGGAGIPAFFTPTGVGTIVGENKETREFDGRLYVMERALEADFAFIKAWKGDKWGNLVYRKTARNFNPMMATAANVTIAEVEHLVEVGELNPDSIHTPSVYVKRIFQGELFEKRIERDRKSTRLNSSHGYISYAVFCLKKKKEKHTHAKAPTYTASQLSCHQFNIDSTTKSLLALPFLVTTNCPALYA